MTYIFYWSFLFFLLNSFYVQAQTVISSPPGCEDISFTSHKNGWFVSSSDRRSKTPSQGSIYFLTEDGQYRALTHPNFPFQPHGIAVLEKYNNIYLFVINHRTKKKATIERFRWHSDSLVWERSFEGKLIFSPNDVCASDTAHFMLTNDPFARSFIGVLWGFLTHIKQDKVVEWKNTSGKVFCKMSYPNGIQYDKKQEKLYVSSIMNKAIWVYDVQTQKKIQKIKTQGGPDNLEWDTEGNLWFASHISIGKFLKHTKNAYKPSPTYIGKVDLQSKVPKVIEIWQDSGVVFSAASVASPGKNKIAVGQVFNPQILWLEKNK